VNIYFQDESRFGLKTHIGKLLSAKGIKPIATYQHRFTNTYLYGSYSPINGNSFVWEINGVDNLIFESYLQHFSLYKPNEFKIVIIDNAGFHSTKNINVPKNIFLLNIPPYCPELNPSEQVWQYIKNRYKNQNFKSMEDLKKWLHAFVNPKNSYIFYYKAKLPAIIENARNLFTSKLGYNYFTKKFLCFPILLVF